MFMQRVLLSLVIWGATTAIAAPGPVEFRKQAERCRRLLKESVIDFYLPHCLDEKNGGFFEVLKDGKFAAANEKFLTLQARHLWFFSTLAKYGYEREKSLKAASHGYEFLQSRMLDRERGGYFARVSDSGEVLDARKHAYLNSFVLYALVAYSQASSNEHKAQALQAARDLFEQLELNAYDRQFGGFIEFFEKDWTPVTDAKASSYVGAIGHKTYNTHLHLLESFAELYRAWPDARLRNRLAELIMINTSTVQFPSENANVDAFERDWTIVREPRNLRASYGHDVECVWLVQDAANALGMPKHVLLNWAQGLSEYSLKYGYDRENGGFFNSGPLGAPADDLKKTWWVQTEALLGMLEMYRETKEDKYYQAFAQTLDFCEKFQIASEGGWWATRAADGSSTNDKTRTSIWQGGYHSGRALILSAVWLDELAKKP